MSNKFVWIPLYLVVLFFFIYKFKIKAIAIILLIILGITLTDQISSSFFKEFFQRLRPCHNPEFENIVHTVNGYCGGNYGFISSHAANSMLFAIMSLLFVKNKTYTILIIIWAILVSYSRIALGVHYPADVICGIILGIIISFLIFKIYNLVKLKFNNKYF